MAAHPRAEMVVSATPVERHSLLSDRQARRDGPKANHAQTFKLGHSSGAVQNAFMIIDRFESTDCISWLFGLSKRSKPGE